MSNNKVSKVLLVRTEVEALRAAGYSVKDIGIKLGGAEGRIGYTIIHRFLKKSSEMYSGDTYLAKRFVPQAKSNPESGYGPAQGSLFKVTDLESAATLLVEVMRAENLTSVTVNQNGTCEVSRVRSESMVLK